VRALAAALVAVIAAVTAAGATAGEPQKRIKPADQARARAIALKRADFGPGWSVDTSGGTSSSGPRCSYYNPDQSDLVQTGDFDSPDFVRRDGSFASSMVGIFQTAGMASAAYRRVVRPELPRCVAELFAKGIGNPKAVKILSAGPLAFPAYRDRSAAYRLLSSVKTSAGTLRVVLDLVVLNRGRADVVMLFLGIGKPLPAALERAAVARVAGRMG
jgi:hypothetical protein